MIGKTLGRRYQLLEKIGGGGMAEVYHAFDQLAKRDVAIKILRQEFVHKDDFIKRFQREAESIATLSHENVVTIYDVGEEDDLYYIVMEYVEGHTLKQFIQKEGRISVERALDIAKKIASALYHAHQHHIIHRDIKPQNILIGENGEVKVSDFGIARTLSSATITHTGSVLGSVHYLSPEQAKGGYTDEKTDLYSLGIVLYEMVTGKLPFSGDSPISVALKHLQEDFVYPRDLNPEIPQSVENIILKALEKDPTKRYQSAKEMLYDLETALDPERIDEPRIQLQSIGDDDDPTIIIPRFSENIGQDHLQTTFTPQSRKMKKKKLQNKAFPLIIIFSIIALSGIFGFQYINSKFKVPEIDTPRLEGLPKDEAIKQLEALNLQYEIIEQTDPVVKEGYVIKQTPYYGGKMKANQKITLYVSLGKEKIPMPDLVNKDQRQASLLLQQMGFKDIMIKEEYSNTVPSGNVVKQDPSANDMVRPEETKVTLYISQGKKIFPMPNLIGLTEDEARNILLKYGLEINTIEKEYTSEQEKGKIFRQFPFSPGDEVTAGDKVDLSISLGYPKEAKKVMGDVLVDISEGETAQIKITLDDARGKNILWKEEQITGPKYYENIELVLMPGMQGTINVYRDGKLFQMKKINYQ
ncbi:Stk1 family PASTA domain-containing Ser/Thr kinase [Tepidibacillus sp. LV47]|uniref:Stk1 family PASTA domain-containing Ser/Thr kinase n=1 Tax=Tepidibacillus sp. LV47 TaxID=3398228 RepID=UPI003AACE457